MFTALPIPLQALIMGGGILFGIAILGAGLGLIIALLIRLLEDLIL